MGNESTVEKKVFCHDCKFPDLFYREFCRTNPRVVTDYDCQREVRECCCGKNGSNDCKDYRPSLWARIFGEGRVKGYV